MGSIVRFALLATVVVIVLSVVAVPFATSFLAGSVARGIGLDVDHVHVSVDLLSPQLLSGVARSVHLTGSNVDVPQGSVGQMDVTLDDVSLSDHSFSGASGSLTGVRINAPGGPFTVDTIKLDGPSRRIHAMGTMSAANARRLVKGVAQDAGVHVDSVQLGNGRVTIQSGGRQVDASLRVTGGALVLDQATGTSTVLVAPGPSDPWKITSVDVSPTGISAGMDIDAQGLASALQDAASGH